MAYGLSSYPDQMSVTPIDMSQLPQVHQNFISHLMSILQPQQQQGQAPMDHSRLLAQLGVIQPGGMANHKINAFSQALRGAQSKGQVDEQAPQAQQFQPLIPMQQYGGFGGLSR
jgi:hypothetical protein